MAKQKPTKPGNDSAKIKILIILVFAIIASSCVKESDDLIPFVDQDKWINLNTSSGLSGNTVYSIKEDSNGNIWLGTNNGVTKININGGVTRYGSANGILGTSVYAIMQADNGVFYLGTEKGITITNWQTYQNYSKIAGQDVEVYKIVQDRRNNIWLATNYWGGIYIDNQTGYVMLFNYGSCGDCWFANTVLEDSAGNIWIGTMGGVFRYNYTTGIHFTTENGLQTNEIISIGEDRWGNIWFGGFLGKNVSRYNGSNISNVPLFTDNVSDIVSDIRIDNWGALWFGLIGSGAIRFDGSVMKQFGQNEGLKSPSVISIYPDSKGNIWFGTLSGGVFKYTPGLRSLQSF